MSGTLVLTPALIKEDHALHKFMLDKAREIYPDAEIAIRWGFADEPAMVAWLAVHPAISDKIKELKALNEADESVLDRIEHKFAHLLDQGSGAMAAIVTNPQSADKDKIEVMKLAADLSGAKAKYQAKQLAGGTGTPFVINFNFRTTPPQTIELSTTVVDAPAIEVEQ